MNAEKDEVTKIVRDCQIAAMLARITLPRLSCGLPHRALDEPPRSGGDRDRNLQGQDGGIQLRQLHREGELARTEMI